MKVATTVVKMVAQMVASRVEKLGGKKVVLLDKMLVVQTAVRWAG